MEGKGVLGEGILFLMGVPHGWAFKHTPPLYLRRRCICRTKTSIVVPFAVTPTNESYLLQALC